MPATAPIFVETDSEPTLDAEFRAHDPQPAPLDHAERLRRLEGDVAELRETMARFAELVVGEVKGLQRSHAELATTPATAGAVASRRPWLIGELYDEVRTMARMYLDPRYRIRRSTQVLVPLLVLLFALNCVFFNSVFHVEILSSVLEKLIDVVLVVLFCKVVNREIARYRQALAQLLAWQEYGARHGAAVVVGEPATTRLETE